MIPRIIAAAKGKMPMYANVSKKRGGPAERMCVAIADSGGPSVDSRRDDRQQPMIWQRDVGSGCAQRENARASPDQKEHRPPRCHGRADAECDCAAQPDA